MNRLIHPILISLACLLAACALQPKQYVDLESRAVDIADSQSILIQVNHGEVSLLEAEDDRVEVGGQALSADELEYQVNSTAGQILIKVFAQRGAFSGAPLRLVVRIPKQRQVKIETDDASVFIRDCQADVEVASTSGNITIERAIGKLTLRSNRGNITVRESSGSISVVGNYGALTLQNVNGEIAASTIMGNVVFDGLIQAGDSARLETDHGAVSVKLSRDSALGIRVRSASGDVACMLPGIISSARTCDGEIGSGGGSLSIRTVSGAATLQLLP